MRIPAAAGGAGGSVTVSGDGGAGGRLRRLSVIVPVYSERATIAAVLERIRAVSLPGGLEREITIKLAKRGVPIREVAIRYSGRTRAEGKKIGLAGGVAAVWTLVKFRFVD